MTQGIAALAAAAGIAAILLATAARLEGNGSLETADTWADARERRALSLLGRVSREGGAPDVVVSPAGVAAVLAMVREGAGGETAAALDRYLGSSGRGAAAKRAAPPGDGGPALREANSAWVRQGFVLRPAFAEAVAKGHRAAVRTLDFASPAAAGVVNGWVRDATEGKIPTVIEQIASTTRLLVVNALHFKAAWLSPFDSTRTEEGDFTTAGGDVLRRALMTQQGRFAYFESAGFQMVELPYQGGRYAMVVLLPARPAMIDEWLASPDAVRWEAWTEQLSMRTGNITLPRFEIAFGASLAAPLRRLGLAVAFDADRADFTGIADGPERLFLEDVIQKVVLEVDERGTEAAAATVGVMGVTSADPAPPFVFRADRPFLCAVRDRTSGEILFIAAVRAAGAS